MKNELHRKINEEVTRYKNSLTFYAKKCEWDAFKVNAGRLFDYLETIEMSEFERKFFRISKAVAIVLVLTVLFIIKMNPEAYPQLVRIKELMILFAIGGCCFEVYFLYNFRMYKKGRTIYYEKRRDKFISDIERDFRDIIIPSIALGREEAVENSIVPDVSTVTAA
jgi:hypothetical protein